MKRLFITADIHGNFTTWRTIGELLKPEDGLVIAGDLFDTRYGSHNDPDFSPDLIKKELAGLSCPMFYVYGNCDVSSYAPGFSHALEFTALGKTIFLHHGHRMPRIPVGTEIIVQGHTHLCHLEQKGGQIFLNPGSMTCPRNGMPTYAVMDRDRISLVALKTGQTLASL